MWGRPSTVEGQEKKKGYNKAPVIFHKNVKCYFSQLGLTLSLALPLDVYSTSNNATSNKSSVHLFAGLRFSPIFIVVFRFLLCFVNFLCGAQVLKGSVVRAFSQKSVRSFSYRNFSSLFLVSLICHKNVQVVRTAKAGCLI